jgi:hypothetical protein
VIFAIAAKCRIHEQPRDRDVTLDNYLLNCTPYKRIGPWEVLAWPTDLDEWQPLHARCQVVEDGHAHVVAQEHNP